MANTELPLAPIGRIIKESGAIRVSEDAKVELAKALTNYGVEIAETANKIAKYAGRKTIKGSDIKLVLETY